MIDPAILSEVAAGTPRQAPDDATAFALAEMTPELRDAWKRFLTFLDTSDEIAALAPLIEREILIRILHGPQGALLRQAVLTNGRVAQVRAAIAHLCANFARPVRSSELCRVAGMSASTLHPHFRAETAMSPLQYQKALRLQEARRRLAATADASGAAHAVRHESVSQFSREYGRMFGMPPGRDAARVNRRRLSHAPPDNAVRSIPPAQDHRPAGPGPHRTR